MSNAEGTTPPSEKYIRLEGSERLPALDARLLGPADPKEHFSVTIALRRRPDGEALPGFDYYQRTLSGPRPRLSEEQFVQKYGASNEDIKKVTDFARECGLNIEEASAARRVVIVSGTAEQMSKAFAVKLGKYEHTVREGKGEPTKIETYRGRDGFVYIPKDLAEIIVGVFGLDNRNVAMSNSEGPADTTSLPSGAPTQAHTVSKKAG